MLRELPPTLSVHAWLRWDALSRILPSEIDEILEIGAGLGSMGSLLARRHRYVGLEPDAISHAEAAKRIHGTVLRERVEEHEATYDLVCALEVLEHMEDDVAALRIWRRRSRRWLLLSVPMNEARFGPADRHAGHYRRYSRESLSRALVEAGWRPEALLSYGFPAGYALEAVRHRLAARRATPEEMDARTDASGRWLQPPAAAGLATWAVALPCRLLQRPFGAGDLGTGLVALASAAEASEQQRLVTAAGRSP